MAVAQRSFPTMMLTRPLKMELKQMRQKTVAGILGAKNLIDDHDK